MKCWLTCAEIAALKLPGLPTVARPMRTFAARNAWHDHATLVRPRSGQGGGLEFHIDLMPREARMAYAARIAGRVELPAALARQAAAEPTAASLADAASEQRDARLALMAAAERYAESSGLLPSRADRAFCDCYSAGQLDVADWIKNAIPSLTPRTLTRWRQRKREAGAAGLAVDRAAARKGTGVLDRANDGAVKTYMLALLAKAPQLTAHHIRALAADEFGQTIQVAGRVVELPPVRTLQRALKLWRGEYRNALRAVRDPDGFKSAVRFAARVQQPATRLNELWQIDASPADMLCHDGRHALYVCVDVYSRRLIGLVSKTPRAHAVGLLLRKVILAWGVPDRIKTDNGSDFTAHATRRLLAALSIEHETARAYSPEQKGHVERAIGTLQRGLIRTLPGFVGHSVADREVIRGRKSFAARRGVEAEDMFEVALSGAELARAVDEWCANVYGTAPHAGLKGLSPFAVAASAAGPVRRIEDVRALDLLLAPVAGKDGLRTVTKTGLRIGGAHYIGGFLDVGATVLVRMDEADMGRAYVYAPDGQAFLGIAIAPELCGVDPQKAIAAARAEQKRQVGEQLAAARKIKIRAADMAPAILRQALLDQGKLAEFPKPTTTHHTPHLKAASAAHAEVEPVHSAEVLELHAQLRAEQHAPAATVTPLRTEETSHHRWNRARAFEAALARGEHVEPEHLLWLGGYREGPEYRGFALTYGVDVPASPAQQQA